MILIEETDNRFYIAPSTIPDAGLGVFAAQDLPAGSFLEIIGIQVKHKSIADQCTHYADHYKFGAKPGQEQNRLVVPMGYAAIINHAPKSELQNVEIRSNKGPTRNPAAGQMVYFFLRNIKKDEEIFGNYGEIQGKVFEWAEQRVEIINQTQDAWETLLETDIYNLGVLRGKN
jgi:hypothetical protein